MRLKITKMGSMRTFSGRLVDEPDIIEVCDAEFPKEYERSKCRKRLKASTPVHIATYKSGSRDFKNAPCQDPCAVELVCKNRNTFKTYPDEDCDN